MRETRDHFRDGILSYIIVTISCIDNKFMTTYGFTAENPYSRGEAIISIHTPPCRTVLCRCTTGGCKHHTVLDYMEQDLAPGARHRPTFHVSSRQKAQLLNQRPMVLIIIVSRALTFSGAHTLINYSIKHGSLGLADDSVRGSNVWDSTNSNTVHYKETGAFVSGTCAQYRYQRIRRGHGSQSDHRERLS